MKITLVQFLTIILLLCLLGCSKDGSEPVSGALAGNGNIGTDRDSLPCVSKNGNSAIGLLNSFDMTISPDFTSAQLTPLRKLAIGDSFVVNGKSFFNSNLCADCFRLKSIGLDANQNIEVWFSIKHPLLKGDWMKPPSATNRLDLDIFDVALLAEPVGESPKEYPLLNASAYTGAILNADGYTQELADLINTNAVLPFRICYRNENNNRFEMGTDWSDFKVLFPARELKFRLYITMGYGISANLPSRFWPQYFIPEFNRKPAWRVKVTPSWWFANNSITPRDVTIDVYDWNHCAPVSTKYPDPQHLDYISALSDISSVTIEIPGMTHAFQIAQTSDTQTNGWDDPITYTASIANENALTEGEYIGMVKVSDSRIPGTPMGPDTLIDSPDGIKFEYHKINEFATYQAFLAVVYANCGTITGNILIPTCPVTGITDGDTLNFKVTASSPHCQPIVLYEADWDYDGTTFNVDATSEDGIFENGGPFMLSTECFSSIPHTFTVAFRASDSGIPQTKSIFATCQVTVTKCCGPVTGQIIKPSGSIPGVPSGDTIDFIVTASSVNGSTPVAIDHYEADWDYTGTFTVDATSDDGHFDKGGPFKVPDPCISNIPRTFTVAFRATDKCPHANNTIFATCEVKVIKCCGPITGQVLAPPIPINGITHGESFSLYVGASSDGTGGNPIVKYEADWNYDGFNFNPDESNNTGIFHPTFYNPNCGHSGEQVTYQVAFRATDSCSPPNLKIFQTAEALVEYCTHVGFSWAYSWGSTFDDKGYDVTVDKWGNIYVTGYYRGSVDFDPDPLVSDLHYGHSVTPDIFVAKYNSNGDYKWARTWGGDGSDAGQGVSTDSSGNVYVTGYFSGTHVDFDPGSQVDEHNAMGEEDVFLSKFGPEGNYLWSKTWGAKYSDKGFSVVVDRNYSDTVYVTGYFADVVDMDPGPGTSMFSSKGSSDIFICKFDKDGNYGKAVGWGGSSVDEGIDIAVDAWGNVFSTGAFSGKNVDFNPGSGTDLKDSNGLTDAFVSKFKSSLDYQWSDTWGGGSSDQTYGICVDSAGDVISTGSFVGNVDFDPSSGTDFHSSVSGGTNAFISKLSGTGAYLGARTWGGVGGSQGLEIAIDNSDNVYVAGAFSYKVDFDPGSGKCERESKGWNDIFLSKFTSSGDFVWVRTWGSSNNDDEGLGAATDGYNSIYVTGFFRDKVDFDPGPYVYELRSEGYEDVFLLKVTN